MTGRQVPHDLDAEKALLGAMLITRDALAGGVDRCAMSDFYKPAHGLIFEAMVSMYRNGQPCEIGTVADELARRGELDKVGGRMYLTELVADGAFTSTAPRYAAILARHALSRRLIAMAADLSDGAYSGTQDPYETVDRMKADLEGMAAPVANAPSDVKTWDLFWARPGEVRKPWVVPSVLRVGWRAVVVAAESSGKTVLSTQIALCAGQGIHPFTFQKIDPIRSLYVDLENPEEHLDLRGKMMHHRLVTEAGDLYQSDRTWVWHRPGGVNIRTRGGRGALEAAIAHVRPQLVVIAPVYKMFRKAKNEDDEMATGEAHDILDNLRTRYDFALILEHHAPKGITKARDMVPFGSSLWMRWPELRIALTPTDRDDGSLIVGRYRPDRLPCRWPDSLERGQVWPWEGRYDKGMPADPLPEAF